MRSRTFVLVALTAVMVLGLGLPALAGDDEKKPEMPPVVADEKAKFAIDKFKRRFDTPDLDLQLDEVIALGRVHHPKVAAQLLRLMKNKEPEIQAEAMKGLGRQPCYRKKIERKLAGFLEEKKYEPVVVAATLRTIHKLDVRKLEEDVIMSINSKHDEVAIAALKVLGDWRSYKSLREILLLWEFYPDDGKWATGTVTVDTGADTATEQRLAKAKWKAKYGGRAKKARPKLVQALRQCVNNVIGLEEEEKILKRPTELREWIKENKKMLRKHR